ncbi:MAG TPA: hypothetical protein VHE14_06955 [Solirubrobacteraceae bacterium]|nr:hypothetical protein [Solirubrobacteraceae bacterium]
MEQDRRVDEKVEDMRSDAEEMQERSEKYGWHRSGSWGRSI